VVAPALLFGKNRTKVGLPAEPAGCMFHRIGGVAMTLAEKLEAARADLIAKHPVLGHALCSLVAVERPGLGTVMVDRSWRLYYDPDVIERWDVKELAGAIYHEVMHAWESGIEM